MDKIYMVHNWINNDEEYLWGEYERRSFMILIDEFSNEQMGRVVEVENSNLQENFIEGDYVKLNQNDGPMLANDSALAIELNEINNTLRQNIVRLETASLPTEYTDSKNVHSYHINVGHGNCSIVVFQDNAQYVAWMVDCSVYDFMNGKNYKQNLEKCLEYIRNKYGINKFTKVLITHPHFDHINGLQYLLDEKVILGNYTEVWLNYEYHWGSKTYNSILARMKADNFKFLLPICKNSTKNIEVIYPDKNICNPKYSKRGCVNPPDNKVNNASIIYKINLGNKSMIFTGDIEKAGWYQVNQNLKSLIDYYCISHHGSGNGICCNHRLQYIVDKAGRKILMGRDGAYHGIFCDEVKKDIGNTIWCTDDASISFIEIDWDKDNISCH